MGYLLLIPPNTKCTKLKTNYLISSKPDKLKELIKETNNLINKWIGARCKLVISLRI